MMQLEHQQGELPGVIVRLFVPPVMRLLRISDISAGRWFHLLFRQTI